MSALSISDINDIINIAHTVVLIVLTGFAWFLAKAQKNKASIEELEQQDHAFSERIALIEQRLTSLPPAQDIYSSINSMGERLAHLEGQLIRVNRMLDQIHQSLLNE